MRTGVAIQTSNYDWGNVVLRMVIGNWLLVNGNW